MLTTSSGFVPPLGTSGVKSRGVLKVESPLHPVLSLLQSLPGGEVVREAYSELEGRRQEQHPGHDGPYRTPKQGLDPQ